jgi:hypothetical protein
MKYALLGFILGLSVSTAYAYNFYVVNCDTLKGKGEVVVWFDDLQYKIPVECN